MHEQHKVGGGKLFGNVEICRSSYLSKDSFCGDGADVWQSVVRNSYIKNDARVRHSIIENLSKISGGEISFSHLVNTQMTNGIVCGAYVENSVIEGGYLKGDLVSGGVKAVNCVISGDAILELAARIENITLEKAMRVGFGIWNRPPRYFELKDEVADIAVSESIDGHAFILCRHKKMTDWIKYRKRLQKVAGWSDEMIETIKLNFEEWLDVEIPTYL